MFKEFEETLVFYESTYFQSFNVKQRNPLRLPTSFASRYSCESQQLLNAYVYAAITTAAHWYR